jgi:hypothetical protein
MKIEVELVLGTLYYSSQKHTHKPFKHKTLYTTQLDRLMHSEEDADEDEDEDEEVGVREDIGRGDTIRMMINLFKRNLLKSVHLLLVLPNGLSGGRLVPIIAL